MRTLRLSPRTVGQLRQELLRSDEQERFAFLYAGDQDDLLASRVVTVDDEAMARQSPTACRPAPDVERTHIGECYDEGLAPVLTHSHPFSDNPRFSSIDVESMGRFREWLTGLFPDQSFGFAVIGTTGIEAVANADSRLEALSIEVVGDWKLDDPVPGSRSRFAVDAGVPADSEASNRSESDVEDRYDRSRRTFGETGQHRIESASVGIVGVGGLGSIVAEQLARLGVGELVLVDPDTVEKSNLSRLVGVFDHHVDRPKVVAVREHLWRSGRDGLTVEAVQSHVQDCPEALGECDVIVGCVDSVTTRSFCNEYAVKHLDYYLDAGVRIDTPTEPPSEQTDDQGVEMTGYVHLVAPGSTACFDCLGRHDQEATRIEQMDEEAIEASRERGYVDDDDLAPEPAVIHLNGMCASKTVSVLVDLVTGGAAPPDFIRYEDHDHRMTELTTEPSDACPTCGDDGVLGVGQRRFGDAHFEPDGEIAASD